MTLLERVFNADISRYSVLNNHLYIVQNNCNRDDYLTLQRQGYTVFQLNTFENEQDCVCHKTNTDDEIMILLIL